jgi:hypothetical protein
MGTRSQTHFIETYKDDKGKLVKNKFCNMYRQMDGYPEGHGMELAEFLAKGKLVNGINVDEKELVFNGMGCLAAQVIAHFKDGAGGIYIQRPNSGLHWEDYVYEIENNVETNEIILRCFDVKYSEKSTRKGKIVFEGTPEKWLEWIPSEVVNS